MSLTDDPKDPRLRQSRPDGQQEAYLVLSKKERKKGYVRPYRDAYRHVLCGAVTTMAHELAETYARDPAFYGATYCYACRKHYPVNEFVWDVDDLPVGS